MLWLQVFREAVRCGSLGEASRTLGYTQSAVSRHIAALEAEYGIPLLERGPAGVRPSRTSLTSRFWRCRQRGFGQLAARATVP